MKGYYSLLVVLRVDAGVVCAGGLVDAGVACAAGCCRWWLADPPAAARRTQKQLKNDADAHDCD